jgi:5-enolpyruvylshikimate-3-phosphate synthase
MKGETKMAQTMTATDARTQWFAIQDLGYTVQLKGDKVVLRGHGHKHSFSNVQSAYEYAKLNQN